MAHFFAIFIFVSTPAFCLDLKQTQALFNKKAYKEVIQQLSPQIEHLDPERLKLLGQSYQATGDHDQAIRVFESYLSTKPKDFEVKSLLGDEYLVNKKDKEALASYKDAIDLDPKYEPPYLGAAKIYEKRKNKYELRLIYQDLVGQVGEKPEYMKQLCNLTTMDGLLESALEYCKKAKQLKPSEPQNYLNLAIIYKTTGEKDLSLKEFSQAADSFPNSIDAQLALADYFHEDKNYPKALLHYQRASVVDAKNLRALQGEGMTAFQLEQYQQSYDAMTKACEFDKGTAKLIRKILADLRLKPKTLWLKKFETLIESCKGDQGISISKNE